jgi:hypothetical protein
VSLVIGSLEVGRRARRGGKVKVPTPKWMNAATSQGVSRPQEEMDFLPFDAFTLIGNGEGAPPGGPLLNGALIAYPQRPFRGERLVMTAVDDTGANVAANVVIDPAIYVGAVQVGASQGSTPITAFGPDAFGVRLSVPASGQGTQIKIFVRSLVGAGFFAFYTVSAVLIGRAMR